jgi:hypothetical protein
MTKPTRIKSVRITSDFEKMISELRIKLDCSAGEVIRYAIETLYKKHFG